MRETSSSLFFKLTIWSIPLTVLMIDPRLSDPINLPKLLALSFIGLSLFMLSCWNFLSKKSLVSFEPNKIKWLYIVFLGWLFCVALVSTPNWIRALMGSVGRNNGLVYYIVSIFLVCIILSISRSELNLSFVNKWLGITSLIFGAYSALQFFTIDPIPWSSELNRVVGTLGNPNFSASFLGASSIFWLYFAIEFNGKRKVQTRASLFGVSLTLALLSWATDSLQGPLVVAIGTIFIVLFKLNLVIKRRLVMRSALTLFLLGVFFLFLSLLGVGPLGEQLEQYTLLLRGSYISIGLVALWNSPVIGVGVDGYGQAFREYRDIDFVTKYGVDLYADNAHSTPIQIGVSFGLIAMILYLLIHFLILYKALFVLFDKRNDAGVHGRIISLIWILLFAQSLLSIEIIGLGIVNWILGALVLRISESDKLLLSQKTANLTSKAKPEPAWIGSAKIVAACLSILPYLFVAREDSNWSLLSRVEIKNEQDVRYVRDQFNGLTSITLLEPVKVSSLLPKLVEAGLNPEIEETVGRLSALNKNDTLALEIKANYEMSLGQTTEEYQTRLRLRASDPLNYRLERQFAELLARDQNWSELKSSLARIELLAPVGSEESMRAKELRAMVDEFQKSEINP